MTFRSTIASAAGALALAAAAAYAPAASADRLGFNVTFGGPGYAVNVGNVGYGFGYDTYYRPAPVVVAPYVPYAPYGYYGRPYRPAYVVPAPVVRPYPVYRPYYVDRPYSQRHGRPGGHGHNRHRNHR
jgi:hypothetical protein